MFLPPQAEVKSASQEDAPVNIPEFCIGHIGPGLRTLAADLKGSGVRCSVMKAGAVRRNSGLLVAFMVPGHSHCLWRNKDTKRLPWPEQGASKPERICLNVVGL